ncbi:MAG: hypothetical protein R2844_18210 [Caldilineales bacterium]
MALRQASFSPLMEVGFGDELRELKDRWANTDENQRCSVFDAALAKAIRSRRRRNHSTTGLTTAHFNATW